MKIAIGENTNSGVLPVSNGSNVQGWHNRIEIVQNPINVKY